MWKASGSVQEATASSGCTGCEARGVSVTSVVLGSTVAENSGLLTWNQLPARHVARSTVTSGRGRNPPICTISPELKWGPERLSELLLAFASLRKSGWRTHR